MIKKTFQKLQAIPKTIRFSNFLQFSYQQNKVFEGLVLSEKLKYTVQDNYEYLKIYNINVNKDLFNERKSEKFVNKMLLGSIFSRIIGSNLTLSIYLSQKIQILKDVPLNVQIEGRVTVEKSLGKDRYLLITEVYGKDQNGDYIKYVNGQAKIMLKG